MFATELAVDGTKGRDEQAAGSDETTRWRSERRNKELAEDAVAKAPRPLQGLGPPDPSKSQNAAPAIGPRLPFCRIERPWTSAV